MQHKRFLINNSYKNLTISFILGFSIVLIAYSFWTTPMRMGDGYEYILVLQSFFNHFTPDIRISDIASLAELNKVHSMEYFRYDDYQPVIDSIQAGESYIFGGILKSYSGQYFGYHFWFYPLVNLPAKLLLAILNQNEFKAFQLTNAFLMIGTVSYTLLLSKQNYLTRIILVLLYLLGCNFLYIQWTHTELYTAAVLFVASCAFLDKRYRLAVLMAAFGALQNPSAVMLIVLIILDFIVANKGFLLKRWSQKSFIFPLFQLCLIGSIALIPYAFYYYHFGAFNLIVRGGSIDRSLIGVSRLMSFFFDLNQGMIVGFPGILLAVGSLLLLRFSKAIVFKKTNLFNNSDLLLLATLLMALPTLGHLNWNTGQPVFARYAFWTAMPLLVWVAFNLEFLSRLTRLLMLILIAPLQLFPHSFLIKDALNNTTSTLNYVELKPHAKWILNNFPGWYKPEPEIFAERLYAYDAGVSKDRSPYVYQNEAGDILQILVAEDVIDQTSDRICGINKQLVDPKTDLPADTSKVHSKGRGWGYLIGPFRCSTVGDSSVSPQPKEAQKTLKHLGNIKMFIGDSAGFIELVNGSAATEQTIANNTPIKVTGWAILPRQNKAAERVILTVGNDYTIAAETSVNIDRPDVVAYFYHPDWKKSGWTVEINPSVFTGELMILRAWAYDPINQEVYRLNNTFKLQRK